MVFSAILICAGAVLEIVGAVTRDLRWVAAGLACQMASQLLR